MKNFEDKHNIHGPSWEAVQIVLSAAKHHVDVSEYSEEHLELIKKAIKRVDKMLKEEPDRFVEV